MAVSQETRSIIDTYRQRAPAPGFLSSYATRKVFDTAEIEIEIQRDDEDVAIVLRDLTNGPNYNVANQYTNKRMKAPPYGEAARIEAAKLKIQKQFGSSIYDSVDFQAAAVAQCFDVFDRCVRKMMRAGELQMSQILTEGELILNAPDKEANAPIQRFALDFGARASHFADVNNEWSGSGVPLDDLGDFAHTVRSNAGDGASNEFDLILGRTAKKNFYKDETVLALLDKKNIDQGQINRPQFRGNGVHHGSISADVFNFEIWTYPETYLDTWTDPANPVKVPYIPDDYAVIIQRGAVFRGAFGTVERFKPPEGETLKYLPPIMSTGLYTFSPYAFITQDGKALEISADGLMMFYPLTLDKFGRLNTEPA